MCCAWGARGAGVDRGVPALVIIDVCISVHPRELLELLELVVPPPRTKCFSRKMTT